MTKQLFLLAGEQSGDLHGSELLKKLKLKFPGWHYSGVGGAEMREEDFECLARSEDFEVMGFTEVIKHLPTLYRHFQTIRDHILKTKPEATIFIDYPGFNLRMATSLRKKGYRGKLIQYISPTFWAWGKGRVQKMEKNLDLLMTIYPFEQNLLTSSSLNTKYVGNPVYESIQNHSYHDEWARILGIKRTESLISIFPGSRKSEIRDNLPDLLQTALKLKTINPSYQFAISCANVDVMGLIQRHMQNTPLRINRDLFLVPKGYRYELMRDSRTAIAKCGSVTLELALHQRPTVVVYKASSINRFIAKHIIRLKLEHFSIANILLDQCVFPELIKENYTPDTLAKAVLDLDSNGPLRETCLSRCQQVHQLICNETASEAAANEVQRLFRK